MTKTRGVPSPAGWRTTKPALALAWESVVSVPNELVEGVGIDSIGLPRGSAAVVLDLLPSREALGKKSRRCRGHGPGRQGFDQEKREQNPSLKNLMKRPFAQVKILILDEWTSLSIRQQKQRKSSEHQNKGRKATRGEPEGRWANCILTFII